MTKTRRPPFPSGLVNFLLVAIHYSISFEGGPLPIEQANPRALAAARKARLVEVLGDSDNDGNRDETDVELTEDGRVIAIGVLQAADVDHEDDNAVAEWAQSVSLRVKDFESKMDSWSALELHALESMINEARR